MINLVRLLRTTISNPSTACPVLTLVASLAFTTLVMTGPAVAQEDRAETARDTSSGTFPTAESMKIGVAQEVDHGKLSREQADMILRIHQRLLMGIDSGKLSVDEALGIMEQRARALYAGDEAERSKSKADAELAELKAGIEARISAMKEGLTELVDAGSITKEDAEARMAAAERQMWTRYREAEMELKGDSPKKMTRADYDEAVKKMTEMVKAGEITREQMQQRLDRMKTMMTAEKTITRQDYAEAAAKMQKMVEAGEITRQDMETRLGEMRRMIKRGSTQDAGERSEASDDCMELRRTLGEAVRAGKMTREEAGEVWKEEGC